MRMPRFRFTVRGMMVTVAIAAGVIGAEAMRRTSAARSELARRYRLRLRVIASPVGNERFEGLARKYEDAARYPWLPVPPEPPDLQ